MGYPEGGGHVWVFLNWALGVKALGCRVIWLEDVRPTMPAATARSNADALRRYLQPFGLADNLALAYHGDSVWSDQYLDLEDACQADLLLNFHYRLRSEIVERFRRSALVDIDPGLLQVWLSTRQIMMARHDLYFTTGETVGRPDSRFPDGGLSWHYTPPCVAAGWWPSHPASVDAAFTTVSHWEAETEWVEFNGETYANDKRTGFGPFLDLPQLTDIPLELALCIPGPKNNEWIDLERRGWHIRDSRAVASTPHDYQRYIQSSKGEFSAAKPSCVRLQNAWVSDRTLCYLASGKPVIVQHTGPSTILPDAAGMFRFRTIDEAARHLETAVADYDRQCSLARALAEEHFGAAKVVTRLLEKAL